MRKTLSIAKSTKKSSQHAMDSLFVTTRLGQGGSGLELNIGPVRSLNWLVGTLIASRSAAPARWTFDLRQ